MTTKEVLAVMRGHEEDPMAVAILEVLNAHREGAEDCACQPAIGDSDRQFNAGRMAAIRDVVFDIRNRLKG